VIKISIIAVLLFLSATISAHEEPSKTLFEKKQKEKIMKRLSSAGIIKTSALKYEVIDGVVTDNFNKVIVQEYNQDGALTAIESYKNDSQDLRVEYTFDANYNIITDTDFSSEGLMIEKNVYKYDNAGRVISGSWFNKDNVQEEGFIIEKADDHKTIVFVKYKAGDSLDYKLEYKYTDDYDISDYAEANKYDSANKLIMHVEKKYNKDGLATEKSVYDEDMSLMFVFSYEYDNNGYLIKITKKLADGSIEWYDEYLNDSFGNCKEIKSFDKTGLLETNIKYQFEYAN
jgi:hypothetical protein